jgi:hypothetical protein
LTTFVTPEFYAVLEEIAFRIHPSPEPDSCS